MKLTFTRNYWLAVCLIFITNLFVFGQKTKPEAVIQKGQGNISIMKISRDGKMLAAASSRDKETYLWDISSAKLIRILPGTKKFVSDISFSSDNKSLVVISEDRIANVWDLTTGLATLSFNVGYGKGIDFSPDSKLLILSPPDKEGIALLDIEKQTVVKTFGGTDGATFSPDGKMIYTNDEKNVYAWDVKSEQKLFSFQTRDSNFSVSPDGKKLAVSSGKTVIVLDAKTGNELVDIVTNGNEVLSFSVDGKNLFTKIANNKIGVWDVSQNSKSKIYLDETKGLIREFDNVREYITVAATTPDGANIITGDEDRIKIWNIETGKVSKQFAPGRSEMHQPQISPDGKNIFFAIPDNYTGRPTYLWDTERKRLLKDLNDEKHLEAPKLFFSPDNEALILEAGKDGYDKSGFVIDSKTLMETKKYPGNFIFFNPNGKTFLSRDDKLTLRDSKNGELIRRFDGSENYEPHRAEFIFDKTGKTLGAFEIGKYSGFHLWETETGKNILKVDLDKWWLQETSGSSVAFNLDAKLFAINTIRVMSGNDSNIKPIYPIVIGKLDLLQTAKSSNDLKKIFTSLGSFETMLFSPDGKTLIVHDDFRGIIEFLNVESGQIVGKITGMPQYSVISLSENGKRLITTGRNSLVDSRPEAKIYEVPNGELALTVRGFSDGNWIAYSPEGYYQASNDEVFSRVSWRVGTKVYDFERFYERFFKPDLIRQVFGSTKVQSKQQNNISKGFAIPPEVKIKTPENVKSTTSETIALTVQATDQGGGIKDLWLYQNGKRLSEKQRGIVQPKDNSVTFNVSLLPGKNIFRATAFSNDQTESEPFELIIERKAPAGKSDLYILAVGINVYKNAKYNLNYAGADAEALSLAIEKKGKGIFGKVYKTLLTDSLATREGVEKAFKEIADKAKPEDSFVFFYAGHGILIDADTDANKNFYLVPHDVTQITTIGGGELAQKGISSGLLRDWTTQIKAGKQLMMLDACQSGGAIQAFAERGLSEEKAISQLARSAGIVILTASGTEQQAVEFKRLGHGVFTYALLQGLNGEADGNPADGIINVSEIETFLDRKVPELTKEYRGTTQYPQRYSRGQDFPIGIN
jgi:WD40 repeat protein